MDRTEERLAYGIESNSTLLECTPRSLQAKVVWFVQKGREARKEEVTQGYMCTLGVSPRARKQKIGESGV